ncbi:hypothetical protein HGM15179_014755 [Zosterops borbonicus]|uniref:Integrase catalytic domain-containing protein n=1 Tax=Zosterops borbonicus TaxID=364589 RepID=A0A8K1LFS2_9PASS|nr:hypothetical protein HGM15179_014755 [Zosterops borbonicus]
MEWEDGRRQIATEVINKITAMSPLTSKKETQASLGAIGLWRMHIPEYSQILGPLYLVTRKKNYFHWGSATHLGSDQAGDRSCSSLWPSQDRTRCEECALFRSWEPWSVLEPLAEGAWGDSRPTIGILEPKLWRMVEKLPVKVGHVDAHVPKSRANEEHRNNEQVDQAAKIEGSKIDLDWQHKGELFLAQWAHDASGHQGRDATYKWARDRGVDLTMDSISQVIHDCEMCAAIKQAKRVKPLWYGGQWSKYKYGEAWQIDYITLPQTHQGKHYVLTMVEATTAWLETYPVPHATAQNTNLGLEKQVLWRHGTPERIESDNETHFRTAL